MYSMFMYAIVYRKMRWTMYIPGFFIAEPLFRAVPQVEERLKNFVEILIDTYTTQKNDNNNNVQKLCVISID